MGRSEVLPECLFYSWAIHSTYKREAPSSVIFLRVRARSLGEVPKFFFCQRRLDSRNPFPEKKARCHLTEAGSEARARWDASRDAASLECWPPSKPENRAQSLSAGVRLCKKKKEVRTEASLPRLLGAFLLLLLLLSLRKCLFATELPLRSIINVSSVGGREVGALAFDCNSPQPERQHFYSLVILVESSPELSHSPFALHTNRIFVSLSYWGFFGGVL